MFKFLHSRGAAAPTKARRSPRVPSGKRIEPERPVRLYSLLLPPTLPNDRK
jgi:hypothetical protein